MDAFDWTLFDTIKNEVVIEMCCDSPHIVESEIYFITCANCGRCDMSSEKFKINEFSDNGNIKIQQPYKRIVYLRQKLNYISSDVAHPSAPRLVFFIKQNKGKQYTSIRKLRKAMKHAKLHKYYKFIYSVWHAITGTALIRIKNDLKYKITKQFIRLERLFINSKARKNIYSYNLIIYLLLKLNDHPDYSNVLLPYNKGKIRRALLELIDQLNNIKDKK